MQMIEKYFEYCFDCGKANMDKMWYEKYYLLVSGFCKLI